MPFYPRCPSPFDLLEDGSPHTLLEPPCPAYTNVTVRRAFIVWLHCGQRNKFKDVCNYYHYLESLEEKLPANKRAASRHHEFDMFTNLPPKSSYLNHYFPNLYSQTFEEQHINKVEAIRNEKCVFKLEGFDEIKRQEGATKSEIVQASRLIRNYCKSHNKTLRKFLNEFKGYTKKCELNNSVGNVVFYIKRKLVQEELQTMMDCPKNFSFLNMSDDEQSHTDDTINYDKSFNDVEAKLPQKIRILSNENRKKGVKNTPKDISSHNINTLISRQKYDTPISDWADKLKRQNNIDNTIASNLSEMTSKSLIVDSFMQNMQNKINKGQGFFNSHYLMLEMTKFRKI